MNLWLSAKIALILVLCTVVGCDPGPEQSPEPLRVTCGAFDVRCIPCEIEGEGTGCEVDGAQGLCAPLRVLRGPQVLVEGLRCRAE